MLSLEGLITVRGFILHEIESSGTFETRDKLVLTGFQNHSRCKLNNVGTLLKARTYESSSS